MEEYQHIINDAKLELQPKQIEHIFLYFDTNGEGYVNYQNILNECRVRLVCLFVCFSSDYNRTGETNFAKRWNE